MYVEPSLLIEKQYPRDLFLGSSLKLPIPDSETPNGSILELETHSVVCTVAKEAL